MRSTEHKATLVFVLFLGVLSFSIAMATAQVPDHVPWSADQPVSWQLFLAPYPSSEGCMQAEVAAIHMTLSWSVSYVIDYDVQRKIWYGYVDASTIGVTNTMEPFLSWAAEDGRTSEVLCHEQLHFDLNEVYARKLAILLAHPRRIEARTKDEVRTALKEAINSTASSVLDMAEQMQSLYDQETKHGTDAQMQEDWRARIHAWLASPMQAP
jgi:hypothetical protein